MCTSCHQKLSPAAHPAGLKECTSCHMPTTTKVSISHASHTDHRILRNPAAYKEAPVTPKLVAWRAPPQAFRERNLGLAELEFSPVEYKDIWQDGAKRLLSLDSQVLKTDPEVAYQLEDYYFRSGEIDKAIAFGWRSVDLNPKSAMSALSFARVLQASGQTREAEDEFQKAISLDPSVKEAYGRLAMQYTKDRRPDEAMKILDRYLQWNSNEIFFHEMEQRLAPQENGGAK